MKMNSNSMLCGSASNGIVVTDLPVNVLMAMRDSIDATIREKVHQPSAYQPCRNCPKTEEDYIKAIHDAIAAAEDAGYDVYINCMPYEDANDIELYEHDEDEDDEDEDEDEDEDWDDDEDPYDDTDEDSYDYDPCQVCHRKYCEGCRLHEM